MIDVLEKGKRHEKKMAETQSMSPGKNKKALMNQTSEPPSHNLTYTHSTDGSSELSRARLSAKAGCLG